jgi:rhodanese-related sulfurtransferase
MIDVRRLSEYRAGHPINYNTDDPDYQHAYNVPYPNIIGSGDQEPQVFYDEVKKVIDSIGGNYDTPITTLCRTGFRSVLAGNILANPSKYGVSGVAFTNVRNIWEGFVGQPKEAYVGETLPDSVQGVAKPDPDADEPRKMGVPQTLLAHEALHHNYLDLNNNGELDGDSADVCSDRKDANPDKDGWRNYQELPWASGVSDKYAYKQDASEYPICTPPTP